MILIIKHIEIEGPGSIENYFRTAWTLKTIELNKNECLPGSFKNIDAVISLGGPMNVYEEDKYPFLKSEDKFIKNVIKEEIPFLGICLGAQLLAKACSIKVKKAEQKEIGWYDIRLTDNGARDSMFLNIHPELTVFQWHEDTFEIPSSGKLLAESKTCKNQAFKFGKNAYGFQFHIEITESIIESWIKEYVEEDRVDFDVNKILKDTDRQKRIFRKQANLIYRNFARIIELSGKARM